MSSRPEYAQGFRAGVMAERARCIQVCNTAVSLAGNQIDRAHEIAHEISQAGDFLPADLPPADNWTRELSEPSMAIKIQKVQSAYDALWNDYQEACDSLQTLLDLQSRRV